MRVARDGVGLARRAHTGSKRRLKACTINRDGLPNPAWLSLGNVVSHKSVNLDSWITLLCAHLVSWLTLLRHREALAQHGVRLDTLPGRTYTHPGDML